MKLGVRDFFATVAVAAALALALSVTQGWDWPLMNGVRAGILALFVGGFAACTVSGWSQESGSFPRDPFLILASILGLVVLVAGVGGLFTNGAAYLVWMMAATILIWAVTIIHRLVVSLTSTAHRPIPTA